MKNNQILIFITTTVVLYSILSPGTVDSSIINWAGSNFGCVYDGNCDPSEKCSGFSCRSACQGVICDGEQKVCVAVNHAATCRRVFKNAGVGDSCGGAGKECSKNDECDSSEECKCSVCTNVCYDKKCGEHEGCLVVDKHVAKCVKRGKKCDEDKDCKNSEKCSNSECKNACDDVECDGENEICLPDNHKATCRCSYQYAKDTISKTCVKEDCRWITDCKGSEVCNNVNGVGKCKCPPETTNRGDGYCAKKCELTSDCGTSEECDDTLVDGWKYCRCTSTTKFDSKSKSCK